VRASSDRVVGWGGGGDSSPPFPISLVFGTCPHYTYALWRRHCVNVYIVKSVQQPSSTTLSFTLALFNKCMRWFPNVFSD